MKIQSKHIATLCSTCAIALSLSVSVAFAAATPTPNTTATDSAMKNIKERVEMVKQTTDPQVKGMINALKQSKFGVIGTLEKVVGSTLQIKTPSGIVRLAELDHGAVIMKGSKPVAREDIELNAPIIAMGFRQPDNTLLVRRLILADDTLFGSKRTSFFGKVTVNTTKAFNILTFQDGQSLSLPLKITTKTGFLNALDNSIKRTSIVQSDPVVAILPAGDIASVSAQRVYSLSSKAIPSPSMVPTPGLY